MMPDLVFDVEVEKISRRFFNFNTWITISQVYCQNIGILKIYLHCLYARQLGGALICGHRIQLTEIDGHPIKGPLISGGITCGQWFSLNYRRFRACFKCLFDQILIRLCWFILLLDLVKKNKGQIIAEVISSAS